MSDIFRMIFSLRSTLLPVILVILSLQAVTTLFEPVDVQAQATAPLCYNRFQGPSGPISRTECPNPGAGENQQNDGQCYVRTTNSGRFMRVGGGLTGSNCNALKARAADTGAPSDDSKVASRCADQSLGVEECLKTNPIVKDILRPLVNALSALVVLIIIGSLIVAGIRYSSAEDNPQAVQAAKQRIRNSIIALATFLLIYAGLQFLIPGGLIDL